MDEFGEHVARVAGAPVVALLFEEFFETGVEFAGVGEVDFGDVVADEDTGVLENEVELENVVFFSVRGDEGDGAAVELDGGVAALILDGFVGGGVGFEFSGYGERFAAPVAEDVVGVGAGVDELVGHVTGYGVEAAVGLSIDEGFDFSEGGMGTARIVDDGGGVVFFEEGLNGSSFRDGAAEGFFEPESFGSCFEGGLGHFEALGGVGADAGDVDGLGGEQLVVVGVEVARGDVPVLAEGGEGFGGGVGSGDEINLLAEVVGTGVGAALGTERVFFEGGGDAAGADDAGG